MMKILIIFKNTLVGTYTVIMRLIMTQQIVNMGDKIVACEESVSFQYTLNKERKEEDNRGNSGA